jgi:ABC-2 type transport system permease protein
MIPIAFARASLRRIARDRTALFFLVILPILVIVVVGLTSSGGDRFAVGIVDGGRGPLAQDLVGALGRAPSLTTTRIDDRDAAVAALRRGEISVAVLVPADLDDTVLAGGTARVVLLGEQASTAQQAARTAVDAVVAAHAARLTAGRLTVATGAGTFADGATEAARLQDGTTSLTVTSEVADGDRTVLPGGFSYSAPTMLVLMVFINTLASGAALIESRRLGIHARASATPASPAAIVAGETLTYAMVALGQAGLILLVGGLLLGVDWGDPLAAGALVVVWALLGSATDVLGGTLFRTSDQASAIGPALGMGLGMLGGCMWPLEIVGPTMRTIGHLTPHAWAVDAWTQVVGAEAGIGAIAPHLAVLASCAAVLLVLATVRLARRLTT